MNFPLVDSPSTVRIENVFGSKPKVLAPILLVSGQSANEIVKNSLFELLVVFVVAVLVLKPEDVPHIAKKIKEFYN